MNLEKSQAQNSDSEQGSAEGAASSSDSDTKKIKPSNSSCCSCFTTCCCCSGSGKWSFFTSETKLRTLCLITGILHLCALVVVAGITDAQARNAIRTPRLKTPITKNIGLWINANETVDLDETLLIGKLQIDECPLANAVQAKRSGLVVQQIVLDAKGEIDTRLVIIFFHLFSFLFQVGSSVSNNYYEDLDRGKVNLGHYFEYSISASLMLIGMAAQFGITDIYLLLSIGANCAGCMLFGALAELLFYENAPLIISFSTDKKESEKTKTSNSDQKESETPKLPSFRIAGYWIAHLAGWLLLSIALIATCSNLNTSDACADKSEIKMPDWVIIIVSVEVFLFACFGFVQFFSFCARDSSAPDKEINKNIAYGTELAYIILSLTAKMILSILIVANNYTNS
jgi:hypothetical protein